MFRTEIYEDYFIKCYMTFKKHYLNLDIHFVYMEMAGIKHRGSFVCFVTTFVFKLSGITWNHCLSSGDVCSHTWCHNETYAYVFYKKYVSPYHVTRV